MSNTEQILSAGIGATVGFFVGGPAGAATGFQYGLVAGGVLFPADLPGIEGPRLEDFETVNADPGSPIPVGWGTFVVPGFRMYLGTAREVSTEEEVGGKGGPSQTRTTYQYFQTLALGLCEGEIEGVTRIWENGELKYDAREQLEGETTEEFDERVSASNEYAETFTLYLGTEEQEADPTLELEQGAGNVPGYRGLAYIVFADRELLQEQGHRHPNFKIEIGKPAAIEEQADLAYTMTIGEVNAGQTWGYDHMFGATVGSIDPAPFIVDGVTVLRLWSDDQQNAWIIYADAAMDAVAERYVVVDVDGQGATFQFDLHNPTTGWSDPGFGDGTRLATFAASGAQRWDASDIGADRGLDFYEEDPSA